MGTIAGLNLNGVPYSVMPGPVPGIHVFLLLCTSRKTWMAGTSPAMTVERLCVHS
jgi:hypothetical protein